MLLIDHIGKEETKNSRLPAHSPGVCGLGQSQNLGTQSSCPTQVARTHDLEPSSATPGIRSRTRVLQVGCLRPEWTVNWCTQCLSHNSRTTSLPFLCVALRGSLPEPPRGAPSRQHPAPGGPGPWRSSALLPSEAPRPWRLFALWLFHPLRPRCCFLSRVFSVLCQIVVVFSSSCFMNANFV